MTRLHSTVVHDVTRVGPLPTLHLHTPTTQPQPVIGGAVVEAMYGPGVFLSGLFVLDVAATSPRWQRLDECGSHDDMVRRTHNHSTTT